MFQDSLTKKIAEAASKIKTEYHEVEVNVNSVEGAGSKIMDEELKGNQHKIDANKNKKIDSHDFKLLRAQKEKEKANSQKFGKGVKEETEEQVEEVHNKKKDLPFTPDTVKKPVRNSDGTIQSPMSLARELAKRGLKKVMSKEEVNESVRMKEETEEILEYKSKDGVYKHKGTYGTEKGVEYGETDFDKENELSKKHLSPKPAKKKYGARQNYVRSKRVNESFSDMISSYQEDGLKYIASLVKEEPDSEEFKKELEDQKAKMDGKKKGGDVAKASVQAVKNEEYEIIDANEINGVRFATVEEGAKETETRARELADKLSKKDPKKSQFYRDMANQALTRIKKGVGIGSYRPGDIEGGGNKSLRRQGIEPAGKSPVFPFRKEEVDLEERSLTEPEMKKKEEMVKGMKKGMSGFKQRYGDRAKEVMYATATARAKGE